MADQTVLDRLLRSGISRDRALGHLDGGWVRVDGVIVTDPGAAAQVPATVELRVINRRTVND